MTLGMSGVVTGAIILANHGNVTGKVAPIMTRLIARPLSPSFPIPNALIIWLIFGVLIYDMIHITVERILTGKVRSVREWLEYVGKDHLHHRLERALGSRQSSVAMIFLFTICLGLSALALRHASTMEAILLLIQAGLIAAMLTMLEISGRRR